MKNKNHILRVVVRTIKKHLLLTLGLVIAVAGTIIAGLLPPLALENIINHLTNHVDIGFYAVAMYFVLIAMESLFDAAKESLVTIFGQRVTSGLRQEMCGKLSKMPADYFTKNESGVIVSRFVNDVDTVESLFTSGIISMAVDICKVISILAIIFVKSKGLGLLMILVTPFLYWLTRSFQRRMLKAQLANRVAVGKVAAHVPETIKNIRMIHTFGKEDFMENCYDDYIEDSYHSMEKSNFYDAVYSPIIIMVSAVLIAVMMILAAAGGGFRTFFGMSVGTAVAVIAYVGKVFEPLESIGMEIQNIQSAAAGICRINEFLNVQERKIYDEKIDVQKKVPAVELENVCFGYDKEREVLHNYSVTVDVGENVTLAGRTGAGKSTIFKLLLGFYQPWSGNVRIYGVDAEKISDAQKRALFGYVAQTFHLIPGNVRDQITLKDANITQEKVERAIKMVGMQAAIEALENGYNTQCSANLFSQGQLQLLSIARAIVADPKILLLDEITANLDSDTEAKVMEALRAASENRTVISISHRLYGQNGRIINIE